MARRLAAWIPQRKEGVVSDKRSIYYNTTKRKCVEGLLVVVGSVRIYPTNLELVPPAASSKTRAPIAQWDWRPSQASSMFFIILILAIWSHEMMILEKPYHFFPTEKRDILCATLKYKCLFAEMSSSMSRHTVFNDTGCNHLLINKAQR
jgi:hypothetical protein